MRPPVTPACTLACLLSLGLLAACAESPERHFEVTTAAAPAPVAAPAPPEDDTPPGPWDLPAQPMAPMAKVSAKDRRCLALTIYFEARNESLFGQMAVAAVVLNRVRHPDFPDTICGVVHQGGEDRGCQFSWWCDGKSDRPTETEAWAYAQRLAKEMIAGERPDRTGGALFYHNRSISPPWFKQLRQTAQIDDHVYYGYQ